MTLVVDAAHPATFGWRYRNARLVHPEDAVARTAVSLTEADPGGVEVVWNASSGRHMFVVAEGALWNVAMGPRRNPFPADDVVAWIEGRAPAGTAIHHECNALFARTPLLRADVSPAYEPVDRVSRGMPFRPGRDALMVRDGREEGIALQAWLDRNVRVCSGSVLVRSPGPHLSLQGGTLVARHTARSLSAWAFAARSDRAAEAWDWAASRGLVLAGPPALPDGHDAWAHLPALADPEDSDLLLANAAVAWTARALARNFPSPGGTNDRPRPAVLRALGPARDALMPYADLASLGMVSATDAKEAVRACVSALSDLAAFERDQDVRHPPLSRDVMLSTGGMAHAAEVRMSYLAAVVLPSFADVPEPDGDDADALGGLAP